MKKIGITARVGAAILAAAMVMSDVAPTLAAQTTTVDNLAVESTEEIRGSVSGVSKVIGLEGKPYAWTMSSDDGKVEKSYVRLNYEAYNQELVVAGTKDSLKDASTGLYKFGDTYYAYASEVNSSLVSLYGKVTKMIPVTSGTDLDTVLPKEDETTGLYQVDGKLYAGYSYVSEYEKDAEGNVVYDENGNLKYKYRTYYFVENNEVDLLGALSGTADSYSGVRELLKSAYGKKLAETDTDISYYEANGKLYASAEFVYDYVYDENTDDYVYQAKSAYAYKKYEISFDKKYHRINWNSVSNVTEVDSNGKPLYVGYQVKVNGEMATLGEVAVNGNALEPFTEYTGYTNTSAAYAAGETANYEVRAVYYTETNTVTKELYSWEVDDPEAVPHEESNYTYDIVKVGEWSSPYSYSWSAATQTVPAVTGLTATVRNKEEVELSWNAVSIASGYEIERFYSVDPVDAATIAEDSWRDCGDTYAGDTTYKVNNTAFGGEYITEKDANGNIVYETKYVYDEDLDEYVERQVPKTTYAAYNYAYYRVRAYVNYDTEKFVETYGPYSNVAVVTANKESNTPAITGLKVENNQDGTFDLKWNNIDKNAQVVVYYSDDKNVFASPEYTYSLLNAWGTDTKGTPETTDDQKVYLTNTFALQDTLKVLRKKVKSLYLEDGANEVSSDSFSLVPGKKYYFVVATYDDANYSIDRSASTPYVANVARVAGEVNNVSFGHYNDVVTSSVISAKATIEITEPSTTSAKTSITMNFDKNSIITGYQIYRKNSKGKFAKIATISSAQYVDSGLTENTVYDYKVRGYYYDPDTKVTAYSDYVNFSAETSTNNYMTLKVDKKSKTSAKLTWTKVAGASKYEIYRTYTTSTDTNYSKKNGYGNGAYALSNAKWELVKTVNKAKTVTYTDKKLKAGTTYIYRVVATFNSGKTTKQIFAIDSVALKLTAPQNVKTALSGTNVKVTWDKDTLASKYEVSYIRYNANGEAYTDDYVVATTTKASYTIKNVGAGESVTVRVRAYGSKVWSEYTTVKEVGKKLAVAKSVTAKEITEKDANGAESTVVKISWKKVSGAAYYVVRRSTSPAAYYNKDEKYYYQPSDAMTYISKESNDDETNRTVLYKDYKGKYGTVVGTSAVDRAQLQTGVTYYYYVLAYSEDGQRMSVGYSKPASICYKATPSIKSVKAQKGKNVVTINKVAGAQKYVVYRSTKKDKGYEEIGTTTKTTYTDKTVKKGKVYYYKVVAVGTNGLKADFTSAQSAAYKAPKAK